MDTNFEYKYIRLKLQQRRVKIVSIFLFFFCISGICYFMKKNIYIIAQLKFFFDFLFSLDI